MTAIFRIIQSAAPGEWGIARQDLELVGAGGTITLEAQTQVSPLETYLWEVISQPEGSVADTTLTVPNPATAPWTATLDLDVTGGYVIRLIYQPGTPAEDITILYLGVPLANSGLCLPAFNETMFDNSYAAGGSGDDYVGYERKLNAVLKWTDANVGAGGIVHALGGAAHSADTLANLNTKISDATLFGQELFDANTMLVATVDNTPAPLVIAASSFVGRKSSGNISAMTPAEARTVLDVAAGADVTADNPPQAHHASHENGGGDEISVVGLSGVLADAQNPTAHALGGAAHSVDTLANLNTKISDADLSDVASGIGNDSTVSGANVDDALDNLDAAITSVISGYSRRKKVINIVDGTVAPPTEVTGDRYIPDDTGALHADWDGASAWDIVEFDSANWVATTPIEGWVTYVDTLNQDALFVDDGAPAWELRDVYTSLHADLTDIGVDDHHDMVHDHSDDPGGGLLILNSFYDNDSGERTVTVDDGDIRFHLVGDILDDHSFVVDLTDDTSMGGSGFKVEGYSSTYLRLRTFPIEGPAQQMPLLLSAALHSCTINTTNLISLDANAENSNFSVTGAQLTISTITSGELDLTSAGLMDINAGANLDIDVTGNYTLDSTGLISIDATGTIDWSGTNASLTTAGALAIASDLTLTGGGSILSTSDGNITIAPHGTGNVGIGGIAPGYAFSVGSTDLSNQVGIYHDNTNAYFRTDDGSFVFQTDEGTNTITYLDIKGKGLERGWVRVYDQDDAQRLEFYCSGGLGYLRTVGVSPGDLLIQNGALAGVTLYQNTLEGSTEELKISGYRTSDAKRTLEIGVGIDAADTASFDGLSNYLFDGAIQANGTIHTTLGGASTNWVTNSLSMGHDSSGHTSWIQSGDTGGTTLFINPQGGLTVVGGTGVGGHALGSGDVYFPGRIEVDAPAYFDLGVNVQGGQITLAANRVLHESSTYGGVVPRQTDQTPNCMMFLTGSLNNHIIICDYPDRSFDFEHSLASSPDPTLIGHSGNPSTTQYWGLSHNKADFKTTIGAGSKVVECITPIELIDDASFTLPDNTSGYGTFQIGNGKEIMWISWPNSTGAVSVVTGSFNTSDADDDNTFCAYKVANQVTIKNRLGTTEKVMFNYTYWTPSP